MQDPNGSDRSKSRGLRGLYGRRGIVTYAERAGHMLSRPDGPLVAVLEIFLLFASPLVDSVFCSKKRDRRGQLKL